MSSYKPQTNYFNDSGNDIGNKLITKDYLLSLYPKLSESILNVTPELWVWGNNTNTGKLGDATISSKITPITTFAGGTNWKQVSAGNSHTAAIKIDGTLWTWGLNSSGQLGINNTALRSTPVTTFAGGTNWKQVSAGANRTIAIKTDGNLWVWGTGNLGRLGTNDSTNRPTPVTTFAGGTNWKQVSAGYYHTTAVKTDGTLWTWGYNHKGQLGTNDETTRSTPVTTFAGGTNWKQVSAGTFHTSAVKTDGTLSIWGYNYNGYLGTNDSTNRSTPVTTFAGGTDWKQVSAGSFHTTAIKTDGTLWTWGLGNEGQLGTNDSFNIPTPVTTFAGGNNWADTANGEPEELYTLSAGYNQTAAIKTDGTLWTWGVNWSGYLGINDETGDPRYTPVTTFAGGTDWKQVAIGYYSVTAAIKTDGTLWLWGRGPFGQLGTNDTPNRFTPVTTFAGGTNWKQVSAGQYPVAAIKTDGTLWTWGRGNGGVLGTNDEDSRSTPVTTFAGGTDWKQISCGDYHVAAIKTDGTLWTWGWNFNGYLGTNDTTNRSTPVTTFSGGTDWKQVSGGASYTTAIKTDGTLWTWGYNNNNQLGINNTDDIYTPVTTFAGGTNWKQVSAGKGYPAQTAAVKTDGTLWTWGYNNNGQLGTNDTITRSTPVTTFAGGTNWKQVFCGYKHTVALQDDGVNKQLFTFGSSEYGALGSYPKNFSPSEVFGNAMNWRQVSAGGRHTSAIKTDGTLWTWGRGGSGELGTNDTTNRSTPVTTFAGGTNWKQVNCGGYYIAAIRSQDII
jgi:alpha-tubulin suppressor-like RCC1 family protein